MANSPQLPQNVQIPQLTPEQKAERDAFIRKKQIFMTALAQAIANGMKSFEGATEDQFKFLYADLQQTVPTTQGMSTIDYMIKHGGYVTVIMSHDFAKFFFGQGKVNQNGQPDPNGFYVAWQFHLMQLAITPDKFEYLFPFLKPPDPKQQWR